jgi:Flp pilus assembly protein TadG
MAVTPLYGERGAAADVGERGGAVGVEMALLWIAILGLVAAATQVALVFYAGQLALTAAQDGVHAGATQNPAAARAAAQSFLARASGTAFAPTKVTVSVEQAGGVLRVQVRGQALSLIPGMTLPVDKSAVAALERVTP